MRTPGPNANPNIEILDLRRLSPLSGEQPIETAQTLALRRSTRHVVLKQSRKTEVVMIEEIAVFADSGANVFDTTARPSLQDEVLLIRIDIDLRRMEPGSYRLGARQAGLTWTKYHLYVP